MPAENPSVRPTAEFNLAAIPNGREDIARLIVKSFADAGFGGSQQIAALANAIAESDLDPAARPGPPDQGVGLFQLNRAAIGAGHAVAELEDAANNINLILAAAKKFPAFAEEAASLEDAVSAFVRGIARPANPAGETARRLKIAERLMGRG